VSYRKRGEGREKKRGEKGIERKEGKKKRNFSGIAHICADAAAPRGGRGGGREGKGGLKKGEEKGVARARF